MRRNGLSRAGNSSVGHPLDAYNELSGIAAQRGSIMNRIPRIVLTGALGIALWGAAAQALPTADTEPGLGTALTLSAEHGEVVEVTPLQVVDPAQAVSSAAPPTTEAGTGTRLVAVKFRLKNVGSVPYKDVLTESAALIDSTGEGYPGVETAITAGPSLSGTTTLGPRASKVGFVVFEIPESARAAHIQFAMDSGLALMTGKWLIK